MSNKKSFDFYFLPFTKLLILGREARTYGLALEQAEVALDSKSQKIVVDSYDATSAGHIFAIGDAINVRLRNWCELAMYVCAGFSAEFQNFLKA